ncbi:MAG: hypothetical protein AAFN77_00305 [Planctomycetota bacterium]
MNEINKQVNRARRRMLTGTFFSILTWATFFSMLFALVGIAIPKIWHLEFLQDSAKWDAWLYSWIIGSVVVGFLATACLTWTRRGSKVGTAVEVDRRFGLKARLSSAMVLSDEDAQSPAGQALINDAQTRASDLAIAEEFGFKPTWHALLPLAPLVLMIGLIFVPNAEKKLAAEEPVAVDKKQTQQIIKDFKKKVEEKRKQLEAKGLKDASEELKSLGRKFDKLLTDESQTQKETLVKLNDIKKAIEDRRKELGDSKEFKKNLNRLKNVGKGPAKKLASAIGDGDFEKAKEAIKDLAQQLKDGKMDKETVKQLADDLNRLAKAIKKAAEDKEREIAELEDKLKKAKQEGDVEKAAKLQEELEKKQQQKNQMDKMNDIAKKLQKCADCMKPGNGQENKNGEKKEGQQGEQGDQQQAMKDLENAMKEAGESLEDIAKQMEELQKQMEEMEALEDLEQDAEDCKDGCQGEGEGKGQGKNKKPKWADWAKGQGKGMGLRDRADDETNNFKSRVRADVTQGETVITGTADGDNITGRSVSETKELVRAAMDKDVDPTENQKLTKKQMEHAKEYFKALREQ